MSGATVERTGLRRDWALVVAAFVLALVALGAGVAALTGHPTAARWAVPAGGVDRTRAPHWFDLYGPDVLLLIGGSLLREPDLEAAARELVGQARAAGPPS